jgi:hypothetical protein
MSLVYQKSLPTAIEQRAVRYKSCMRYTKGKIIIIGIIAALMVSATEFVYAQYEAPRERFLSVTEDTSKTIGVAAEALSSSQDNISWLGLRCGMQANGAGLARSWTISLQYDIRNDGPIGLYSDLQVWRHLQYGASPRNEESFTTWANLACGVQVHFSMGKLHAGILGGVGTPIYTVISPQYGISLEYLLSSQYRLWVSQKKIVSLDHFFLAGFMCKLN